MEDNTPIEAAEDDYAEFEAGFSGDDGYQTEETQEGTEENTGAEDTDQQADESQETDEGTEDDAGEKPEKPEEESSQKPQAGETFTLRVNKEDRTVSREEVISLAQKGADYDRVKGQLQERDNTITQLQKTIDGSREALEVLEMIAQETKTEIPKLLESLHLSLRMKNGETEAEAKANIRAIKAERAMKASQPPADTDGKQRAMKEVAEFHQRYPGVELTEELCGQLMADVQKGTSLSNAYAAKLMADKDARIAELERQMAAKNQNDKNRSKALGSQKDSGGRRSKNAEDDFFAAFEK